MTTTRIPVLLIFFTILFSGCASRWKPEIEIPAAAPRWRDASGMTIAEHLYNLTGFRESGSSAGAAVRALVFGRNRNVRLIQPIGVAVGTDGRIAVVDAGCSCVHLYDPGEERYKRISGSSDELFRSPIAAVFGAGNALYVSDSAAAAVFVFDAAGEPVSVLQGTGKAGFIRPTGLAYSQKNSILYVADTAAHAIYAFDGRLKAVRTVGGRGSGQGKLNFPTHLYSSYKGVLYVTDAMNFRVQLFDFSGAFLSLFGRHGDGSGDFAMPKGIAADRDGTIYVADSLFDAVQLFGPAGQFFLTIGNRGNNTGEFWMPSGIYLDEEDRLYVCDTYNRRVQVLKILRQPDE